MCLAHLDADARNAYFEGLRPGDDVDHRGTSFDAELLGALKRALYDPASRSCRFGQAGFVGATFTGEARFTGVTFSGNALFEEARFSGNAYFDEADFYGATHFSGSNFTGAGVFTAARFWGRTEFEGAWFAQRALWGRATFRDDVRFDHSRFDGSVSFHQARMVNVAFRQAVFTGNAVCLSVTRIQDLSIKGSVCAPRLDLDMAAISGACSLEDVEFKRGISMRGTSVEGRVTMEDLMLSDQAEDFLSVTLVPREAAHALGEYEAGDVGLDRIRSARPRLIPLLRVWGNEFGHHVLIPSHPAGRKSAAHDRQNAYLARRRRRRTDAALIAALAALSILAFFLTHEITAGILDVHAGLQFEPSETGQIITAVSGMVLAIGTGGAAVVKAIALLIHARADIMRARAGLPPAEGTAGADAGDAPPGESESSSSL
ncbi:pentapeptide repeat-containing protein [Streptomyces sp. NPDC046465]|uniref:pentapeptide repeat-containing protein n=1 Tax=Streptomyces sp. NPDC046465 TaxID=3155810 RepID=UPI0033C9ED09